MMPRSDTPLDIQITYKEIEIENAINDGRNTKRLERELEELKSEWELRNRKPMRVPKNSDNRLFWD